jgi:hypothetical protein
MRDITIEDTITIPKEWVPVMVQVMSYVVGELETDEVYSKEERKLIESVSVVLAGLAMRMKNSPLVALPRIGDE